MQATSIDFAKGDKFIHTIAIIELEHIVSYFCTVLVASPIVWLAIIPIRFFFNCFFIIYPIPIIFVIFIVFFIDIN